MATDGEAARLRAAFDAAFAAPRPPSGARLRRIVALREGGETYALPLEELLGVERLGPLAKLPTPVPGLLGVIAMRGELAPVHRLAVALGVATDEPARWVVRVRTTHPQTLAAAGFAGYLIVRADAIHRDPSAGADAAIVGHAATAVGRLPLLAPIAIAASLDRSHA